VRRAFDLGITHFDLANNYGPPYGSAEANFGLLMQQDLRPFRDELVVSSKAGYDMSPAPYGEWGSRKYLLASLDQSLQRIGLESVDIFYSHRFDPARGIDTSRETSRETVATTSLSAPINGPRCSSATAIAFTSRR
jgi:L-glyceraldehyde 3-phosphate reductase